MIKEAINTLVSGKSLSFEQAAGVMEEMMSGEATPAQIGAFVTALRIKGETVKEIAGLASVMRAKSVRVKTTGPVIDIVGTGVITPGVLTYQPPPLLSPLVPG